MRCFPRVFFFVVLSAVCLCFFFFCSCGACLVSLVAPCEGLCLLPWVVFPRCLSLLHGAYSYFCEGLHSCCLLPASSHNPKVVGSNPAPATILVRLNGCSPLKSRIYGLFSCFSAEKFKVKTMDAFSWFSPTGRVRTLDKWILSNKTADRKSVV